MSDPYRPDRIERAVVILTATLNGMDDTLGGIVGDSDSDFLHMAILVDEVLASADRHTRERFAEALETVATEFAAELAS